MLPAWHAREGCPYSFIARSPTGKPRWISQPFLRVLLLHLLNSGLPSSWSRHLSLVSSIAGGGLKVECDSMGWLGAVAAPD
jgi:hypothetical protein